MKKILFTVILALSPAAFFAAPSFAASDADPIPQSNTVVISALGVTVLVSTILPLINGVLTRLETSSFVKGLLNIILNGVNSLIVTATLADGTAIVSWQLFISWALGIVTSVATYANVWKPLGATSSAVALPDTDRPGSVVHVPGKLSYVGVKSAA